MPQLITVNHENLQKDFESRAPPRRETKATLAQIRDERRCHRCGLVGSDKLQTCARCKFAQYCSKECQVADWPEHKAKCRSPVVTNGGSLEQEYPDLAMKFATRIPACDFLLHLLQTFALSLNTDISTAETRMLRVTVSTQPANLLEWAAAHVEGRSNAQIMLKFAKLDYVPLSLTPAMLVELGDAKLKAAGKHCIIPLLFTNGVKDFFYPSYSMESAVKAVQERKPFVFVSRFSGQKTIPFGQEGLQEAMNNFVLMDKKNQFKLRAIPK